MSRPNRCIKDENGNDCWISRSTVVIPIVFKRDYNTGDIYTLVEKRGDAVEHPDEWCCPCGYLDYDEDFIPACIRELKEETGMDVTEKEITFFEVNTNIKSKNQTIDLWHECWVYDKDFDMDKVITKNEVKDLKWLKVANMSLNRSDEIVFTLYNRNIQECYGTWAFILHPVMIKKMLRRRYSKYMFIEDFYYVH